ncbi:GAF domain-containing protein [Acidovorax sp. NCPPB 3576]|uniref:GAF domain-containing protein n=1 Tax=Acidovorax sp. NCPPB 3576 TaxID=2940488 RepID=UPI0023499011|nr:GAF domain-containing protein [Acidovorax sp. NCPPB 3576]WCM87791.1 GAF domain-containing protein [Acidovorax sp. NCPPB 3576]
MTPASPPENEAQRLRALQDLMLLDTPPEERFDRFVRFAAEQLDVPIALMSLIDGQRQWFKSRVGLDVPQTSRDVSFCAHAILQPDLFVVEDANLDARFADNPLVTQAPHIRFYAGAPLCAPTGERLGTLCIIDTKPRSLTATERAVLRALGTLANETIAGKDSDA